MTEGEGDLGIPRDGHELLWNATDYITHYMLEILF